MDSHTGFTQNLKSTAGDPWVGVLHGGDDFRYTGGDDGFGARAGAATMRTGFQIDVERRASRLLARLIESNDFSVLHTSISVEPAADYLAIAHKHGANHGIGTGLRSAQP